MAKVYVVWNKGKTEGVCFADEYDAMTAAGKRRPRGECSSLAEYFREAYADEDIFEKPDQVFEIQEIEI